ncbi:hypothetical protein UNPF46_08945 [Bradyrhizobium sp. UNPF46]|nr:hypothetical protein UNPF46_08945 [Bradyrhizobium sp. UNPF46]
MPHRPRPEAGENARMDAEIIEFPERGRDHRLVSSTARLEAIVREVERLVADEPQAGIDRLLSIMERMGDQLVDLASLMLDEESKLQARIAFKRLSDQIAETRAAFDRLGGGTST